MILLFLRVIISDMPNLFAYRFILFILLCGFLSTQLFSQIVCDSLLIRLEHASQIERPEFLNQIAENIVYDHPAKALEFAQQALDEAEILHDKQNYIEALLTIGDCHFYLDEYQKAEGKYLNALELSVELENRNLIARSNYYLAYLYDVEIELEKACHHYELAINNYDSLHREDMVADLSFLYADLLTKKAENYPAKIYYEKALMIYESAGKENDAAETLNSMGLLFYNMGNYEKAVEYYNRSLALMLKVESVSGVAQAINNLGILYHSWGNPDEALKYYEESLRLEEKDNDKPGIAGALNNIGIIYSEKGDDNKAIDYYEKSLALYEAQSNESGIATALNNLGESFKNLGEHDLAGIMLKKSLAIEKELGDIFGVALAYITICEIYFDAGNLELSRLYSDSSLTIANQIKNPEISLAVFENLYKLSEAVGDYKNALLYYMQMTALKDSLFNKDLHKQISEVKAQYELEKKEQEISLLNSRNKLNELDIENKRSIVARQRTMLMLGGTAFLIILVILLILFRQTKEKKAAYIALDEKNKEILNSREELVVAKDKAEESDRLKSVFLANMSHELRTPLNGILGFTDVLRTEIYDEVYREMADIVHTSGTRLLNTLNSIIDLSIIESNNMQLEQDKIKPEEYVDEAIALYRASAFKKNLLLTGETDSDFDYIITDRKVLVNLLNNLIDNAIKYTSEGSVQVKAIVEKDNGNYWFKISVSDTGIGIDAQRLKHIFDKFRQGSEGHDRQFEGAGLGLTICKKYVELLHGRIIANSEINKGSEFRIEIPVQVSGASATTNANTLPTQKPVLKNHLTTPRVLIVENDDINRKHIVYTLNNWCSVKTAINGSEAIEQALDNKFDVILMDINLGAGPNGMETAKQIRLLDGFSDIPIIAVTANAMKGHRKEFLANGCTHYLAKPFSADQLNNIILEATGVA